MVGEKVFAVRSQTLGGKESQQQQHTTKLGQVPDSLKALEVIPKLILELL